MADTPVVFSRGLCTYVDSADAVTDHSGVPYVPMRAGQTTMLLRLGVGDPLEDAQPSGAWPLTLTAYEAFDGTVGLTVKAITGQWDGQTGYADAPTLSAGSVTWSGTIASGASVTIDVASLVPSFEYGWAVYRTDAGVTGGFFGTQVNDERGPSLLGDWVFPMEAPTGLSPCSGQIVGEPRPTLTMRQPPGALTAIQVQISASASGWTESAGIPTPDYDSGTLSTTVAEFPLKDVDPGDFPNLTAATYYWTVRFADANGWGAWAVPVSFGGYVAKATATFTSPLSGLVSDVNPAYAWTVLAGTQTAYQVVTYPLGLRASSVDDSGLQSSTVHAYQTNPDFILGTDAGVLLTGSAPMTAELHLFDAVENRVETPGCPVYSVVTADYQFTANETVPAPESVSATQVGSSPWVDVKVLSPVKLHDGDFIIFSVDGKHIARRPPKALADPVDVEGSWLYTWRCFVVRPFQPGGYRWSAKLVIGGVASKGSDDYQMDRLEPTGLWVGQADPKSKNYGKVAQCSGAGTTTSRVDQVAVMTALGAHFPMAQYVASGAIQVNGRGLITDTDGVSAGDWEGIFHGLSLAGEVLQLAMGNLTMPVVLFNYSADPVIEAGDVFVKDVTFTAIQLDLAKFADEPPNFGEPTTVVYTLEEGTDGATIERYDADAGTGSPGVIDKDGVPHYSDAAGIHGSDADDTEPVGFDTGWSS